MWVGAGIASAQSFDLEGGRAREHRQHVPVATDPEQHEIEHRPAVDDLEVGGTQFPSSSAAQPAAPQLSPIASLGAEWMDVPERQRYGGGGTP